MPPPDSPPTAGVLFDVGYGLCDEGPRCAAAVAWLCNAMNTPGSTPGNTPGNTTPAQLESLYQQACAAPQSNVGGLLAQAMIAAGVRIDLAKQIRTQLPWDAEPLVPLPGMIEALQQLRDANLRLGVLANQPVTALDDLKRCGAADFCDDIWLSDAVGLAKPDPAFFDLALNAWALPPECVAYVGDRPDNDIAPANRLNLYTIRLHLGPHAQQPAEGTEQQANFNANTLSEVANHLVQWKPRIHMRG